MAKVPYAKPFLPYQKQIQHLKNKGLVIRDEQKSAEILRRCGYYRLSGYWFTFKAPTTGQPPQNSPGTEKVLSGYSFDHAVMLYDFDRKLRLLIMEAVERIEIAVRHEIAHQLGNLHAFAHHEMTHFTPDFWKKRKPKWNIKEENNLTRSSELFADHFKQKHNLPIPIWISVEVWDFGMLSTFYDGLKFKRRRGICSAFGMSDPIVFGNWLRSINQLRNVCAHHGRAWNKVYRERLSAPSKSDCSRFVHVLGTNADWNKVSNTVYAPLLALRHLTEFMDNGASGWHTRISKHLKSFPSVPNHGISQMGVPITWDREGNWQ